VQANSHAGSVWHGALGALVRRGGGCLTQYLCRAGQRAVEAITAADRAAVPWFRAAAAELLRAVGDPEEALALALVKVTGHSVLQARRPARLHLVG